MRRGQAWSMDLVIGVLIFLLTVGVIYSLLTAQERDDPVPLAKESEVVATKLTSDPRVSVAMENKLDMQTLVALAKDAEQNYTQLKQRLGIEHEFCIYLLDEEGSLAYITDGESNYTGVGSGSDDLNISGVQCGREFNIDNP